MSCPESVHVLGEVYPLHADTEGFGVVVGVVAIQWRGLRLSVRWRCMRLARNFGSI